MKHKIVISVGANCGDRKGEVSAAIHWLGSLMQEQKTSRIYETPCVGDDVRPYLNAVISGIYEGDISSLETNLKNYEVMVGRDLECRERGDVPVDIDLVICDGKILKPWDFKQKFFRIGFEEVEEGSIL